MIPQIYHNEGGGWGAEDWEKGFQPFGENIIQWYYVVKTYAKTNRDEAYSSISGDGVFTINAASACTLGSAEMFSESFDANTLKTKMNDASQWQTISAFHEITW